MLICIAEIFRVLGGKVPRKLTRVPQKNILAKMLIKLALFVKFVGGSQVLNKYTIINTGIILSTFNFNLLPRYIIIFLT